MALRIGSDNPSSLKLGVFVVCSDKVMLQFGKSGRPITYEAYQSRLTKLRLIFIRKYEYHLIKDRYADWFA
jgi:hypothetical protein